MPAWRSAEELVAAIEHSLAPDARVEHNVFLPVLGQSRARQCDVVLRVGQPPREQVFIIEVQKRNAKPDINTFGGWLRKMDEVGANGLICVSEAGFPRSIIDDVAMRVGPKVKLMTLEASASESALGPFFIVPEFVRSTYKIRLLEIGAPTFWNKKMHGTVSFERGGRVLSHTGKPEDARTLLSVAEGLVREKDPHTLFPPSAIGQPVEVNYILTATETMEYWLHADQGLFRLETWPLRVGVRRIDQAEPMVYSKWSYKQEFHEGTLAWIASSSFEVEDVLAEVTLIFAVDAKGFLQPSMILKTSPRELAIGTERADAL